MYIFLTAKFMNFLSGVQGPIVCGSNKGKRMFSKLNEMLDCMEVFGFNILHDLLRQAKDANWSTGDRTKTRCIPKRKPRLNPEFKVAMNEPHKRVWHLFKILGEASDLLCQRTNKRAARKLRRKSDGYRKW